MRSDCDGSIRFRKIQVQSDLAEKYFFGVVANEMANNVMSPGLYSRLSIFTAILIIWPASALAENWVRIPGTQYYLDVDSAQQRGVLGRVTGRESWGERRVFEFDCDLQINLETGKSVRDLTKFETSVRGYVVWPFIFETACKISTWWK